MKLIYTTMNISRLDPFIEILEKRSFSSYQIVEQVQGRQFTGDPRMNTSVWPGHNSIVYIQCESENAEKLLEIIREMNRGLINESERILAMTFTCDDFVYQEDEGDNQ